MVRVSIEKLVYGGYGMGRLEGKAVFVPLTAPGDVVEVDISDKHKGYDHGVVRNVLEASSCRIEPGCKYFGICGGCHLQHINYAAQILWKQIILEEQLVRIGRVRGLEVLPTIPSSEVWGYRNRIQVHREDSKIGFLERESDRVVDVDHCPIADHEVNKKLQGVRKKWPSEEVRLEISKDPKTVFAQVNPYINEVLKATVVKWTGERSFGKVLELYAGSGNLTFPLAEVVKEVIAVESDERALEEAEIQKTRLKGLGKIDFVSSTAEEYLASPSHPSLTKGRGGYVLVLVDPPREGLGKDVVEGIVGLKSPCILYVSCDPSTLARDIKSFSQNGYLLKRVQPLDMFPQTYHIESVSELVLK